MESIASKKVKMNASNPIRIGIDGRILMHYEMRGFARYTVELFRAMKEIAGDRVRLFSLSPQPIATQFVSELEIEPVVFPSRREILWEQVELPKHLRENRIDVFHATANRGLPWKRACNYVLTCHDVIDRMPKYSGGETGRGILRKQYADFISRRRADKYITVSNYSKQDICRFHGIAANRVAVIYNAASPRFYVTSPASAIEAVRYKYVLPSLYFLFLGGFDKKKNVGTLVDAYSRLPNGVPPLVLAGERKWDFARVNEKIAALELSERIFCPGKIDDEDLPALYQGALALVHPSRYEGFGLQLVEAMASGLPVLASETTSLPEVLFGSGLLFDPENPDSIARQMERVVRDPALRALLSAKSRQRAAFFSWKKAAEQTLRLYLQLLNRTADFIDSSNKAANSNPSTTSERFS
jgi:glycosyltransferase involved in cell wall biosynthesis